MANYGKAINDFRFLFERFSGLLELLPVLENTDVLENRLSELQTLVKDKELEVLEWNKAISFAEDKLDAVTAKKEAQALLLDEEMKTHLADLKAVQENMINEARKAADSIAFEAESNLVTVKNRIADKAEELNKLEALVADRQANLEWLNDAILSLRKKLEG
jgi:predicted  nucleic acid-binding Zn-ribbon protein